MSVKYGLLGLLARQAQHGYELKRSFEQFTGGFWELNHGQIYQSLERLAADGLVSFTVESAENAPERKVYETTEKGRQALARWLERRNVRVRPLRDELFVRLAVMADQPPQRLRELIADYRHTYSEHMRELTLAKRRSAQAAQPGAGPDAEVEQMLIDAAIFHCEADLRWLDHCEAKLAARQRREAS